MDVISLGRVRRSIHAGFNQLFTVITNDDNEILFEINNRGSLAKNARRPIPSSKSRIDSFDSSSSSSSSLSSLQQPPSSTIKKLLATSTATNMSASHVASLSQRARLSNHNHTNSNHHNHHQHNHQTSTSVSRLVEFPPPSSSQHGSSSTFEITYESSSSASSSSGSSSSVWDAFGHMYSSFKRALLNLIDNTKVFDYFSKLQVFLIVFITTSIEKIDDS